jgi:hypothetical protein
MEPLRNWFGRGRGRGAGRGRGSGGGRGWGLRRRFFGDPSSPNELDDLKKEAGFLENALKEIRALIAKGQSGQK